MFRRQALDLINRIAAKHAVTPHVARLAAVLSRSRQIIAIPGTGNLAHLQANMAAMRLSETEDFGAAWLVQRKVIMSLRERHKLEDLKRRLTASSVQDYLAASLPPRRARTGQGEDAD